MLPGSILLKLSCQHDKAWAYTTTLTRTTHLPTLVPLPPTPNTKIPPTFVPPPHTPHGSPSPDATQCQVCQTPFIEKKMLLCDQANIYSLQAPWTRVLDHSVILSPDGLLWFDYVYHVAGSTGSRLKQISVHCKPLGPGSFTTLGRVSLLFCFLDFFSKGELVLTIPRRKWAFGPIAVSQVEKEKA